MLPGCRALRRRATTRRRKAHRPAAYCSSRHKRRGFPTPWGDRTPILPCACPDRKAALSAVERHLADKKRIVRRLIVQAAISAEDSQRHGEIEPRSFLANVRGSQVDGGGGRWNVVAAVFQRRPDALAAFPHRGVGQPDRHERVVLGLYRSDIDLHLDEAGVDAIHGGAKCLIEHAWERTPTTLLHLTDFGKSRCDRAHAVT